MSDQREALLRAVAADFGDLAVRAIAADFLEEAGAGPFVVVQRGVYRHNIVGVFSRLDLALAAGVRAIEGEHDHYHDMEVFETPLDQELRDAEPLIELTWIWFDDDGRPTESQYAPNTPGEPLAFGQPRREHKKGFVVVRELCGVYLDPVKRLSQAAPGP